MISGILIHKASVFTFSLHGPEKLQGIRDNVAFKINDVHRVDFIPQSDFVLHKSLGWHRQPGQSLLCDSTGAKCSSVAEGNCFLMWQKHTRARAGRDKENAV